MSNHEALRRALCEAEAALVSAQELVRGPAKDDRQAGEDLRFARNIVAELRYMLEGGTWAKRDASRTNRPSSLFKLG